MGASSKEACYWCYIIFTVKKIFKNSRPCAECMLQIFAYLNFCSVKKAGSAAAIYVNILDMCALTRSRLGTPPPPQQSDLQQLPGLVFLKIAESICESERVAGRRDGRCKLYRLHP